MFQKLDATQDQVKGEYPPEIGNLVGVFGLTYPGASYGIITNVYAVNEETGAYDVRVVWYAKASRKRARNENKAHNATGRIVAQDTMDTVNQHYQEAR